MYMIYICKQYLLPGSVYIFLVDNDSRLLLVQRYRIVVSKQYKLIQVINRCFIREYIVYCPHLLLYIFRYLPISMQNGIVLLSGILEPTISLNQQYLTSYCLHITTE